MIIHFKLKIKGSDTALSRFHACAKHLDKDWPFVMRIDEALPDQCPKCKGYEYKNPLLTPEDLHVLAKQCHLSYIKVKRYQDKDACLNDQQN